jgi:hypothetical protein
LAGDKMSETVQLEQLLNEKTGIEDESRELDEEQRQLKLRAKMLTEKIIQELKKKNNTKQDTVNKLQSKVGELESQLNSLSVSTVLGDQNLGAEEEVTEGFDDETLNAEEDSVSVTEVAKEVIDESLDSKDKKKRKFF